MGADVAFVEDVSAFVAFEFAGRGDESDPVENQICVFFGLERLDVGEGAVDGAQELVADMFALGVGIQPVAVFPEVGHGTFHAAAEGWVFDVALRDDAGPGPVFEAWARELAAEVGEVAGDGGGPGDRGKGLWGGAGLGAEEDGVTVVHFVAVRGGEAFVELGAGFLAGEGGGVGEEAEGNAARAVDEDGGVESDFSAGAGVAGVDGGDC